MTARRHSWRRRAMIGLAAAGVLALLALGFRPTPRLIDAEPVVRGHLALTLEAEGKTRVIDRYQISAPIAGVTRRLRLEVGDPVDAGGVVAILDAMAAPALSKRGREQAQARVAGAESDLAATREAMKAAEAAEEYARAELARLERLSKRGMVSRTDLDRARSDAKRAQAELASAAFRVRTAENDLSAARTELTFVGEVDSGVTGELALRSPISGRVLSRGVESAHVAQPGDVIMVIGDPSQLEVEVDVLSADAVRLSVGMRVLLERWGHAEPLEGRVKRIEPSGFTKISALGVEEQRVWVIVEILSPRADWQPLGDGYRVNAKFVLWESEDVLQLPTSSLFRDGGQWSLFLVRGGRAQLRAVEIGHRGALQTEILGGVEEGDRVIVHPDREIVEGVRVVDRVSE